MPCPNPNCVTPVTRANTGCYNHYCANCAPTFGCAGQIVHPAETIAAAAILLQAVVRRSQVYAFKPKPAVAPP